MSSSWRTTAWTPLLGAAIQAPGKDWMPASSTSAATSRSTALPLLTAACSCCAHARATVAGCMPAASFSSLDSLALCVEENSLNSLRDMKLSGTNSACTTVAMGVITESTSTRTTSSGSAPSPGCCCCCFLPPPPRFITVFHICSAMPETCRSGCCVKRSIWRKNSLRVLGSCSTSKCWMPNSTMVSHSRCPKSSCAPPVAISA
mmetsp:Transcript_34440/g.88081  ORF Transcript_34440/g.88081 Transcript_34440/m.88081 type:complete len:204 (-) Transcript_34440:62-673(-)